VTAPTAAAARDVCIEGESGLLNVIPSSLVRDWNRSLGEMVLTNGSRFKLFSADEPDRLRGYQHHRAWCDELASWRYPDAWDQLLLGLRLGDDPRVVVTTTPRPVAIVRTLLSRPGVVVTRGSTFENSDNLAPAALEQLKHRYENTRIGRQELYAELLDDVPGALWQRDSLEQLRVTRCLTCSGSWSPSIPR
jgi:phage terminase large subunit-like protein